MNIIHAKAHLDQPSGVATTKISGYIAAGSRFYIPVVLVKFTRSFTAGIFLHECILQTNFCRTEFARTHQEWLSEFSLTREQVDSARDLLEANGILSTIVKRVDGLAKVHYRLDGQNLESRIEKFLKDGKPLKSTHSRKRQQEV